LHTLKVEKTALQEYSQQITQHINSRIYRQYNEEHKHTIKAKSGTNVTIMQNNIQSANIQIFKKVTCNKKTVKS